MTVNTKVDYIYFLKLNKASLVAQLVKNPPAMQETWVRPLGWEEPLEKGKAPHSRILAWRILCGHKESDTTERLSFLPSFLLKQAPKPSTTYNDAELSNAPTIQS